MVLMNSCHFRVLSIWTSLSTLIIFVAKKLVIIEMMIPDAEIIRGNKIPDGELRSSVEDAPITSAAQLDSANEPNKSLPIPAISPTLSPTLSAMTPGFCGESS